MQYPARFRCRNLFTTVLVIVALGFLAGCEKLEFEQAGGESLDWDDLRGQWVLVNYWAEWCKPCLEEIPELNRVNESGEVTVLGVNFDGVRGQELVDLGDTMGIEFTMLAEDPGGDFGWKTPVALPDRKSVV